MLESFRNNELKDLNILKYSVEILKQNLKKNCNVFYVNFYLPNFKNELLGNYLINLYKILISDTFNQFLVIFVVTEI